MFTRVYTKRWDFGVGRKDIIFIIVTIIILFVIVDAKAKYYYVYYYTQSNPFKRVNTSGAFRIF